MAAVATGDNKTILEAIKDRLIAKVAFGDDKTLNDQNCFICAHRIPQKISEHILLCTVSPSPAAFPQQFQMGSAGYNQVTEEFGVDVTLLSWVELDEWGRADQKLTHPTEGMFASYKRPIMRALLYDDDNGGQWTPKNESGQDILRDNISITNCTQPEEMQTVDGSDKNWLGMTLTFRTVFDWDLVSG